MLYSLSTANILPQLYHPLEIRIILVDVVIWSQINLIAYTTDAYIMLDNFQTYHRDANLAAHDAALLLT